MLAGNTVVFKPSSAAPISGVKLVEAYRDAGVPDGVINLVMGPGDTVGAELRENPGIDGIVFTGSYEVGMDLFRTFSTRLPEADDRRDGRQEPGGRVAHARTSRRRPRGSCAARSASAARSARRTAGSTSRSPSTTSSSGSSSRRPRRSRSATRCSARTGSARSSTRRRSTATRPAVAEARRDGRVFTGGERLTDRGMDRGFYVEPTVVGNLPGRPSPVPGRAVRAVHRGPGRRLVRRGDPPRERHRSTG